MKLYSFVAHDEENKQIVCISEFVSSSHSSSTIEKYLVSIKNNFKTHSSTSLNIFPAIIVTDHCWASINAIHAAFNGISIIQYLNWAYDLIVSQPSNFKLFKSVKTKHLLCSTHFLKNIVKEAREVGGPDKPLKAFIYSFTLLLNSSQMSDFLRILEHMFIVFNAKFKTTLVSDSTFHLQTELLVKRTIINFTRNYNFNLENYLVQTNSSHDTDHIYFDQETLYNLRQNSPFRQFFDSRITTFHDFLRSQTVDSSEMNDYCNPKLFDIVKKCLYIFPLWSGIILRKCQDFLPNLSFTTTSPRVSNNYVENYFNQQKHSLLSSKRVCLRKLPMPSEYISRAIMRLKAQFLQFYAPSDMSIKDLVQAKQSVDDSGPDKLLVEYSENWYKTFKTERKHGAYFKGPGFKHFEPDEKMDTNEPSSHELELLGSIFSQIDPFNASNESGPDEPNAAAFNSICERLLAETQDKKFEMIQALFISSRDSLTSAIRFLRSREKSAHYDPSSHSPDPSFEEILRHSFLCGPFVAALITGDGNCLYRSISVLLFGNEVFFPLIKACSLLTLLQNQQLFSYLIERFQEPTELSLEVFLENHAKSGCWGNEIIILALSLTMSRPVVNFSINNLDTVDSFKRQLIFKYCHSSFAFKVPLLLGLRPGPYHFAAIIEKNLDLSNDLPSKLNTSLIITDYFARDFITLTGRNINVKLDFD